MKNRRDEFPEPVKKILEQRVNSICSNPNCKRGTKGPRTDGKVVNNGVAAHICAAAPNGPRYDKNMTSEQRMSQENGIWLCQSCSTIIDRDKDLYTVDLLRSWKSEAEERARKGLVQPIYESTFLKDNSEIQFDNRIVDEEQPLRINYKNNFLGVSKEYLQSFETLKDYIYCNYYSSSYADFFNKKFKFKDKKLNFCKDLLDWVMGSKSFPLRKLKDFYDNVKIELVNCNNNILEKRWNALYQFFDGKLDNAKNIYINIKDDKNFIKTEQWVKDDILIDGRNILIRIENRSLGYLENIFQQEIEKNNHNINYPNTDRLKCDLYENVIKHIFDYQNKSKYTQIYGVGLEHIFNSIQELVYITITLGSITHLILIRKIISEVMSVYANCYGDDSFYKITLKQKILAAEFKDFNKIFNKIKSSYNFIYSNDFINSILSLEKSILPYDKDEYYILIFNIYGRYLDDNTYKKYEGRILKIISSRKRSVLISNALDSIPSNIDRFINKENLFKTLIKFIKDEKGKYFNEIEKIISNIKFKELNVLEQQLFVKLIKKCSRIKEINIIQPAIEIKNANLGIDDFDNLLLTENTEANLFYNLDKDNTIDSLIYIINEMSKRAKEREEKPNTHIGYGINYYIGPTFFEGKKYNKQLINIMKKDLFPLATLILCSKNQYAYEKIKMLKTLAFVFMRDFEHKENIKDIIKNVVIESSSASFYAHKENDNIKIYLLLFNYLFNEIKIEDLLTQFLNIIIEKPELLLDISEVITMANKYKKIGNKTCINILYHIFNIGINNEDTELKRASVKMAYIFINTTYFDYILKILIAIVETSDFSDTTAVANMIYSLTKSKRMIFNSVINAMAKSKNYNIRYIVNKYFI